MNAYFQISLPVVLLLIVFITIAIRKIGKFHLPIWLIMLIAAVIVLVNGDISFKQSYQAINFDVLFYLFGVFVIGQALESSHYLEHLSFKIFNRATNLNILLMLVILIFSFSSCLLMNDTIAIIGTPVILLLARQHQFPTKPFLLALAYSVTLGSVMSPVGNPQNLLIANSGLSNPFLSFIEYLMLPTLINLIVLYVILWLFFRRQLSQQLTPAQSKKEIDSSLARIAKFSLLILIALIILKIILSAVGSHFQISFSSIAIIACLPILLFSKKRFSILRHLDWYTLLFFIGLFVFMRSVWLSHYFQGLLAQSHIIITHKGTIFAISVVLSQLISNVPLVALYLPLLHNAHITQLMALAAGSTVAGNLLILGAASNVIVIQSSEKHGNQSFSFLDFFKIGLPLTICNVIVYYLFL